MTRTKKFILFVHRWLGFISGLVVFIVAVTGCLFCFQKELSEVIYQEQMFVKAPVQARPLPFTQLNGIAKTALQGDASFVTTYKDVGRAWEFMRYQEGNPDAFWFFDTINIYESVFVNPYTGQITGRHNYKTDFFVIVKYIHWSLLLNNKYGQPIVGYSTLIFVILLITGLVLWWPKNLRRANFNKSFKIKWKASFKRVNYDLHNVPGFYTMLFALILGLTGMVWAMKWFQATVYVVASQSTTPPAPRVFTSDTTAKALSNPMDIAFHTARREFADADRIGMSPAFGNKGVIYASGYRGKEVFYDFDMLQFDQYTGKLLGRENFKDKNNGEKLIGMNYDIHVGAIWGLPGKILAFLASLVAASLPVTGIIIWLGKRKKSKGKKVKKLEVVQPSGNTTQPRRVFMKPRVTSQTTTL
ncbi:PepSY domain-containing protein [Mucilaginibacter sp. Bleaf8]|uniref:PepSY-associated TM helix domain-containing protein n=1 Tax=Mucilaginibacter sp. Bleaf8 TaxID=2834430 RepID=UPI001BCBBB1B|nr:PepSY-associated TM helix domain-containing protein [Mucilaginibacter sp. Bleaf8]MBS7566537.1 PepSY domain-containing protein [Mucilaginibacter sp. Bleaf8]